MHVATVELKSVSPYSQSKFIMVEKMEKESPGDFEKRTWRERIHADKGGQVFIPPMAIKNCLAEAAKYLSTQIPGKGKATYTKHFEAGVLVQDPIMLGIQRDDVAGEWLLLSPMGKVGPGPRVEKCYPVIMEWAGVATFYVFDDTITQDVFRYTLEQAGKFIGIGRFRPRNRGYYGRFDVKGLKWTAGD